MKRWGQKQKGFTIVELLIVIVVIGILAAIVIVAYNGIQLRARNIARIQAATDYTKIVSIGNILQTISIAPGTIARYCLSDQSPDLNSDGTRECGEIGGTKPGMYNTAFVSSLKQTSATLPSPPPVTVWSPTLYYGPTLEIADGWTDSAGNQIRYVVHYWLEGNAQNCGLSPVWFDYSASPVPEGQPGSTAVIRQRTNPYSYTDARTTYCYSVIN